MGRVVRAERGDQAALDYLQKDVFRNALDIWGLQREEKKYALYLYKARGEVASHIGFFRAPEAVYASIGGEAGAAENLLGLVPKRAVVVCSPELLGAVKRRLRYDMIFPNDLMMVRRGEEKLKSRIEAVRLSSEHAAEYASFGASFNVAESPLEWSLEVLENSFVLGIMSEGKIASVARIAAWLPQVAVIQGVETKPDLRRRGFGQAVVSAAVQEGLKLSESCCLFVRSGNEAESLYRGLGFRKIGEDYWVDVGTGLVP